MPFFMAAVVIDQGKDNDFAVIDGVGDFEATPEEAMKNCEILSDYLFVENPEKDIRDCAGHRKENR